MAERARILKHMLKLAPFDGWTAHTLVQAASQAGLDEQQLQRVFPRGIHECLDYFFSEANEAMRRAHTQETMQAMRMPERIEALLLWQLRYFEPFREALRRAIAQRALPWNVPSATGSLWQTVDSMWRLAGDTSLDFSFYTKRMTLAGIYTSTMLYWLNDASDNYADTHAFLKRRLKEVADFGRWKKECKQSLRNVFSS